MLDEELRELFAAIPRVHVKYTRFTSTSEGPEVLRLVERLGAFRVHSGVVVPREGTHLLTHVSTGRPFGDLEIRHKRWGAGNVVLEYPVFGMTLGVASSEPEEARRRLGDPALVEPLLALLHAHPRSMLAPHGLYVICEGYPADRFDELLGHLEFVTSCLAVTGQ